MSILTIDSYLEGLSEAGKSSIRSFIIFMKDEFPQITPKICFAMPMWWTGIKMYDGYVAVSGATKHFSIHFHDVKYLEELKKELPDCTFGKRCVTIKYGDELSFSATKQKVKEYFGAIL